MLSKKRCWKCLLLPGFSATWRPRRWPAGLSARQAWNLTARPRQGGGTAAGHSGDASGRSRRHSGLADGRPAAGGASRSGVAARPTWLLSVLAWVLGEGARTPHRRRSRYGPARPWAPSRTSTSLEPGRRCWARAGDGDRSGGLRAAVRARAGAGAVGVAWSSSPGGSARSGAGSVAERRGEILALRPYFLLSRLRPGPVFWGGRPETALSLRAPGLARSVVRRGPGIPARSPEEATGPSWSLDLFTRHPRCPAVPPRPVTWARGCPPGALVLEWGLQGQHRYSDFGATRAKPAPARRRCAVDTCEVDEGTALAPIAIER